MTFSRFFGIAPVDVERVLRGVPWMKTQIGYEEVAVRFAKIPQCNRPKFNLDTACRLAAKRGFILGVADGALCLGQHVPASSIRKEAAS